MTDADDDVPIGVDFRDDATARAWLEDTRVRRPYRPRLSALRTPSNCARSRAGFVDVQLVYEECSMAPLEGRRPRAASRLRS
ncbi:MAG TPA: hypothetical protein VH143_12150 [Kofleriaceae bacterium]|jgi:hypothetical protein|nr:hypothetical protein [Kofleriaceae bacterium]